jgi:thymidylate synthase (FAD)
VKRVELDVHLFTAPVFLPPPSVPWRPSELDLHGPALIEFCGRACYQSWSRPNAATATNAGYIAHILEVGHLSVLEHANYGFYITGVSRSLTHELVRHRHFSYSQLSQRYVPVSKTEGLRVVVPKAFDGDDRIGLLSFLGAGIGHIQKVYRELLPGLQELFSSEPDGTLRRKLARQAARAILPNCAETQIAMTGNVRAWRHFIKMRATEHADVEIRALAIEILTQLQIAAPPCFSDFVIEQLDDGTEVAWTGGEQE